MSQEKPTWERLACHTARYAFGSPASTATRNSYICQSIARCAWSGRRKHKLEGLRMVLNVLYYLLYIQLGAGNFSMLCCNEAWLKLSIRFLLLITVLRLKLLLKCILAHQLLFLGLLSFDKEVRSRAELVDAWCTIVSLEELIDVYERQLLHP